MVAANCIFCWKQISKCGLPATREDSANSAIPFWEEVQAATTKQQRTYTSEDRTGQQLYVIDNAKLYCKVHPKNHRNINVKVIKHVADNTRSMVFDTIVCATILLVASPQVAIKSSKSHDNLIKQLYDSALGRDAYTPPDLSNVEFHCNRGHFSENTCVGILSLISCLLTCTCPRGNWLLFVLGNITIEEGDNLIVMPKGGTMTCKVREKVFKDGNCQIKLAIMACRHGNGKVIIVASSIH